MKDKPAGQYFSVIFHMGRKEFTTTTGIRECVVTKSTDASSMKQKVQSPERIQPLVSSLLLQIDSNNTFILLKPYPLYLESIARNIVNSSIVYY